MLRSACLLVLAVCLSAAPVHQASQDQPLIRTKRDSTDVDPAESVDKKAAADEAKTLDKKAEVEVDTAPAENKDVAPDIVEEPPAEETPSGGQEGNQEDGKEQAVNQIFEEDSSNEEEAPSAENMVDEDQAANEARIDRIMSEDSEPSQEEASPLEGAAYRQYLRSYIRKYLPYINDALRRKRSLKKRPLAVTAEQMGQAQAVQKGNLRRKRDLDVTPEELEYLLEAERDMQPEEGYTQEEEQPEVTEPVEYGPEEEYSSDNQALADAELLNYLYKNSPEAAEEAAYNYLPPSDVSESWEDYLPEDNTEDIQYEPIVYDGQPGIFIPVAQKVQKRQLLSLVPGNRRKRGNFYPADDSLAGRWGAFIADQRAIKRADAYERLYHLARALRADPYYEEYKK